MRAMRKLNLRLLGSVMLVLVAMQGGAFAEVGISGDPGTVGTPYIICGITEDPEPIGTIWQPFNPDTEFRVVLNREGFTNGDGRPSLIVNRHSEMVIVAWALNSPEGYDVVYSAFTGDDWSEFQVVAGDNTVDEIDPHLTVDPSDGTVHLFYWVDSETPVVMHRQAPADLSSWSDPEQVSQAGEPACRPFSVFDQGTLYVAYEVHDYGFENSPRQVVLASKTAGGYQPEVVAITHHTENVWPQVHSHTGKLWVDWIDSDDEIAWTRQDGQSGWETTRYETYSSPEDREFNARTRVRLQAIQ